MFENLNMYRPVASNIYKWIRELHPDLLHQYQAIFAKDSAYWYHVEQEIRDFCRENRINGKIFFHHSKIRKNK